MSDDRDKYHELREYLRNNKIANTNNKSGSKIGNRLNFINNKNYNNSPNSKENSSNMDSDRQNFKSININYNVHPLIIKDKKDIYFLIMFIAFFMYLVVIYIIYPSEDNFQKLFLIFPILGLPYLLFYIKQFIYNKKYIWFKSNTIEIKENGKIIKLIRTHDIINIKRAIYLRDYKAMINQGWSKKLLDSKLFYLFCALILLFSLFLYCIMNESYIKPLLLTILAILIIPICKFIAFLLFKFELRFILYDSIIIYTKNTQISVTIGENNEFKELKTYILDKAGIDLSKTKKHIVLNDK